MGGSIDETWSPADRGVRARRAWGLLAVGLLAVGAAACGGSDDASDDDTATTEASGDDAETTPGDEGADDGDSDEVDDVAKDVTWGLNAAEFRGRDGDRIEFECAADGEIGSVWGTAIYTDDSSVCSAAVHAGLIETDDGGTVVIEIAPGEDEYEGSEANGVTSQSYGEWGGSFTFPDAN